MKTRIVCSLIACLVLLMLQLQVTVQSESVTTEPFMPLSLQEGLIVGESAWKTTRIQSGGAYSAKNLEGRTRFDDPTNGSWELDVAASKFDPGPAWKKQTRIYKADGKTIKMVATGVNGHGKRIRFEYAGAYDGKDYPVKGNPRVETIAQERIDYYTVKTTTKRDGKITATSTRVISNDGKVMTITSQGTDEKGVTFNNTLVLRKRQKQSRP